MSFRLSPGAVIGVLGGGQLGRMTAMAAARLGFRTHVFTDEAGGPAAQVTSLATLAGLDDGAALERFARACDIVTYETENIPLEAAERVAALAPVHPSPAILAVAQDRINEKTELNRMGVATAAWQPIRSAEELAGALSHLSGRAVLKSARMGYDGKGQTVVTETSDAEAAWQSVGGVPAILEGFVPFRCEVSVIVARGRDGGLAAYPPVENRHRDHILHITTAPALLDDAVAAEAMRIARLVAEELDLVGVLAVEMFVTQDGAVLVNELAPRPHNSGHWTIDAAATSQFEQLVRALAGLPLGSPQPLCPATMTNLIGDEVERWADYLGNPDNRVHLYGKAETRAGRKMGHVTRLMPRR